MEEQMARRLVAAEGKKLQQAGLVARTWGNISCRIDENHFVITPSGLDYETLDGGARLYEVPAEVMSGIMDAWQTAYPMQVYAPQEASAMRP